MKLTNSISSCVRALNTKRNAEQDKQAAQKYAGALNGLSKASADLRVLCDVVSKLSEAGIVTGPVLDAATRDELLNCVNDCGNGVYENTLSAELVNTLKAKTDLVRGQVQILWKNEASRYAGDTTDYLAMTASLTGDPKGARELADRIQKTADEAPTVKSINQLVKDVAQAKQITDAFSLNPTIEWFLRKVSKQQATILDLTPEVLTWLKEKRLMDKLKIRFSVQ